MEKKRPTGRGAGDNPVGRFEARSRASLPVPDLPPEDLDGPAPGTLLIPETARSIISTNDSPDIPFDAGLNPYRGCEHGCSYCYARPTHEYLGHSAGLDFETKIIYKRNAPDLLRKALSSPGWKPRMVAMSGVTDCYQPAERRLALTRGCLEVFAAFRNPVGVITKNHLVTRDADLLSELARFQAAGVMLSITTLDEGLARVLEPRASRPAHRLAAVELLAKTGVPVGVMVAPVIPAVTDHEMPAILKAAADAGATHAGFTLLRLPHGVKDIFSGWLERHFPDRQKKVLHRLEELRGGRLSDSRFGARMRGEGIFGEQIARLFEMGRKRAGLEARGPRLSAAHFRRPGEAGQLSLFK